nr:HD domain-containing protein [Geminicoccus harenae]
MMIPTDRFDDALGYASRLHRAQLRKGTRIPYVAHLLAVAAMVIEHGGDEDQAIAALLHDAAEDQGGAATLRAIEGRFGAGVAAIVADCTDSWVEPKPPWRTRKAAYLEGLHHKPARSLLVSLADKTHNARAILADRWQVGEAIWDRFTGGRDGTLWYYDGLARAFQATLPGPLADELAATVRAMAD